MGEWETRRRGRRGEGQDDLDFATTIKDEILSGDSPLFSRGDVRRIEGYNFIQNYKQISGRVRFTDPNSKSKKLK